MKILLLVTLFLFQLSLNAQKIKVACIGDSITEGAELEKDKRYPEQLQALLGDDYDVKNFGVGARTMLKKGDYSYWQESAYKDALNWKPDIVIIKLGTNDSKPQNWIYSDEFSKDYTDFVKSFKALNGSRRIYVCSPVPVFQDNWGITQSVVSEEIIPLILNVAKVEHLAVIDLHSAFGEKGAMFPDGVHPNAEGARKIAEIVFSSVKQ